jgi:hypothetical protein
MGINMHKELEPLGGVEVPQVNQFWQWCKQMFTPAYQNEIEAYLSESVDHSDLEKRQERLIRRGLI